MPGNAANENLPERDPRGQGGKRPRWEQRTDRRTDARPPRPVAQRGAPSHLVCSARGLSKEANHLGLRSRPRQAHHARGPRDRDTAVGAGAKDSPLAHDDALSRGQTRPREGARKDRQAARHADVTFPEGGARPARDCGQTTMKTTGARTSRQRGQAPWPGSCPRAGSFRIRASAGSAPSPKPPSGQTPSTARAGRRTLCHPQGCASVGAGLPEGPEEPGTRRGRDTLGPGFPALP